METKTFTAPEGSKISKVETTDNVVTIVFEKLEDDKIKIASDFLFNICQGMSLKMTGEKEITYYDKNGDWIFQQDYKKERLWFSYYRIWQVLESKTKYNNEKINDFIKGWVETNLNWKGLTPDNSIYKK